MYDAGRAKPLAITSNFAYPALTKPLKKWEDLTIRDNCMFQKVMRDGRLCRRLLERLLGITISKISFPDTEKAIDTDIKAKSVRLDVYVEEHDSGRVFDVEMQSVNTVDDSLALRTRYYQAMIDQCTLEKGQKYRELRESYIIFVCAFDPFGLGLRRYTFCNRCCERSELLLPDKAVRIFFNAKGRIGDETEDVRAFLDYVNSLTATDGFAAEVAAAVEQIKANAEERKLYMTLAMDIDDYIEREKVNWTAEGEAKGEAKAIRDIAMRLFQRGVSAEQIAEDTGLSVEEVRELGRKQ